jgi:tetratricopeptide (TPR) repeat protein
VKQILRAAILSLSMPFVVCSQVVVEKPEAKSADEKPAKANEEMLAAQRRSYAVAEVISLADEARRYSDKALRAHVLARAASTLWDADRDTARALFYRAWEAAEMADAEEQTKAGEKPQFAVLKRALGHDSRSDVIRLAANRDRALGEEFLKKLTEANERESKDATSDAKKRDPYDSILGTAATSKRLEVARSLLDDGKIDLALEFAAPALSEVNQGSIDFLSSLRVKNPTAADERFAFLLAGAEANPSSDANTVSGLSCYVFTPGAYITYSSDGSPMWGQGGVTLTPPDLPAGLRQRFFQVAAGILGRPVPPPEQDYTTSGRAGKYLVIKRLLPLFNRYAPDLAAILYSQLASLAGDLPAGLQNRDSLLTWNLRPQPSPGDALLTMQDKLDHAKSSREGDQIYMDTAIALSSNGDPRARDIAKEIEDSSLRDQVRRYVDFGLVQSAVSSKKTDEIIRLAKTGELVRIHRVWAYLQAARLLMNSDRPRALSILDDAATEARRIDVSDPDRARALTAVATQLVTPDSVHAWEILSEAVKAANSAETFNGEDTHINAQVWTKEGPKIRSVNFEDLGLGVILRALAKAELERSIELAKSFKNEKARAAAILTIADAALEKPARTPVGSL